MTDSLLPRPQRIEYATGWFAISRTTTVSADKGLAGAARWFAAATRLDLAERGEVAFVHDRQLPAEAYRLTVAQGGVQIAAADEAGAFYGAQTLRQLLGPDVLRRAAVGELDPVRACTIEDRPLFGWRGCLLDVARHFPPKDYVLRFIDVLALHKLNVLHLHLSDDQGWRMQIHGYPRLTEVGGWRSESAVGRATPTVYDGRPHGGFYSQPDLREIVAYAAERHIMVLPEIDVPGHSQAAIAAYPELGNVGTPLPVWTDWGVSENVLNVEDSTLTFFRNVLDEVMDVFPSPYVSLGGDEVPTTQWQHSPRAQERRRRLGLDDEAQLQSWFIGQLAEHLATRRRRLVVWDELVDTGLPDGALVQSWRGIEGGLAAIRAGHDVVMCPEQEVYLDHRQADHPDEPVPVGYLHTLEDVYRFSPIPPDLPEQLHDRVRGAQAQLWTEHLDSPSRVDYAAFPRLSAFAEVVWSGAGDYTEFVERLETHHLPRLDAMGVGYRPLSGPHPWQTRPGVVGRSR